MYSDWFSQIVADCMQRGNPLAAFLVGKPTDRVKTAIGLANTRLKHLDGRSSLDSSIFSLLMWYMVGLYDNLMGRMIPTFNDVLAGGPPGTLTVDETIQVDSPVIATQFTTSVTQNTVNTGPVTIQTTRSDKRGILTTTNKEMEPYCGDKANFVLLSYNVPQTVVPAGANTCAGFLTVHEPGNTIAQNTAAFIAGGQVPVSNDIATGFVGTALSVDWKSPSSPEAIEIRDRGFEIMLEMIQRHAANQAMDTVKYAQDAAHAQKEAQQRGIVEQILKGNTVSMETALKTLDQNKTVQNALANLRNVPQFAVQKQID